MRIVFVLAELVLLFFATMFVLTQVVMPAFRGTALFPFFRREQRLKEEIFDAQQELREDALESTLDDLRAETDPETPTNRRDQ